MVHKITPYNDPLLRKKSAPIAKITPSVKSLIHNMIDTMYAADGIGLSAIQIGCPQRVFVMQIAKIHATPQIMINPHITQRSADTFAYHEGCLSIPGVTYDVTRPRSILLDYYDENFIHHSHHASELVATCIQHEIDHLDGILFLDRVKGRAHRKKLSALLVENGYPPFTNFTTPQLSS